MKFRFPAICRQNRLNNVSVDFYGSEQGILRVDTLSGNRRNKLSNRFATLRNGYSLSGLYDLIENRQTFCFEFRCVDFSHVTRLHDRSIESTQQIFGWSFQG